MTIRGGKVAVAALMMFLAVNLIYGNIGAKIGGVSPVSADQIIKVDLIG